MPELATVGESQRVVVYGCELCERTEALGFSSDPWWVSAKARAFLRLRREAFRLAGLEPPPAIAIFDSHTPGDLRLIAGSRASNSSGVGISSFGSERAARVEATTTRGPHMTRGSNN
jgi:hypothetical protein